MWKGDPRTTTPEWRRLRLHILDRDRRVCHVCHNQRNPGPADEVDHLRTEAECRRLDIDPDDPANLAAIHDDPCHREKSSAEGNAEQARLRALRLRPTEPHPGRRALTNG